MTAVTFHTPPSESGSTDCGCCFGTIDFEVTDISGDFGTVKIALFDCGAGFILLDTGAQATIADLITATLDYNNYVNSVQGPGVEFINVYGVTATSYRVYIRLDLAALSHMYDIDPCGLTVLDCSTDVTVTLTDATVQCC